MVLEGIQQKPRRTSFRREVSACVPLEGHSMSMSIGMVDGEYDCIFVGCGKQGIFYQTFSNLS